MKTIAFIRHAKSDWSFPELSDFDRPLNKRGKRDAPEMGTRLSGIKYVPEYVFTSPSARTTQTLKLLSKNARWHDVIVEKADWIYEASPSEYLNAISQLDEKLTNVCFCGHNPTLTTMVGILSGRILDNIPTAGVAIIDFDRDNWRDIQVSTGEIRHYDFPGNQPAP